MSDCWRAYDCLSSEDFVHQTVNHSQNFVSPDSGAHRPIEHLWRDVRGGIPRFGHSEKHLVGYLAEFLFKRKFLDHRDRVHAFFSAVDRTSYQLLLFISFMFFIFSLYLLSFGVLYCTLSLFSAVLLIHLL